MPRIFISHSSDDNFEAQALVEWMVGEGWQRDELFLDIDRESGIAPGQQWEKVLNESVNRCEAVVLLISRKWLASEWCLEEFNHARHLNKVIIGALIEDIAIAELPERLRRWQVFSLTPVPAIHFHVKLRRGERDVLRA